MVRDEDWWTLGLDGIEVGGGTGVGEGKVEGVGGVVGVGVSGEAGDVVGCGWVGLDGRDAGWDERSRLEDWEAWDKWEESQSRVRRGRHKSSCMIVGCYGRA